MPLPLLILLFMLLPLVELYLIFEVVGDSIGAVWTILLLAADSVLGAVLLRSQGRAVWSRFNAALAAGQMPHREVQHGIAVISGGALLITPGFLTDILGLLLLIPPTRAVIVRLVGRRFIRRMSGRVAAAGARPRSDYDVEGTATEQPTGDAPRLER